MGALSKWLIYNSGGGGWGTEYSNDTAYAGGNGKYVAITKLTAPTIPEGNKTTKITVNLAKYYVSSATVTLRWALCTSDANKNLYKSTYSAVDDSYSLTQGTVTLTDISGKVTTQSFDIEVDGLTPGQTYYLFFWSGTNASTNTVTLYASQSSAEFEYAPLGLVYIDNGIAFEAYQPYIDDGTKWVECIPHISNGTDFEQCN